MLLPTEAPVMILRNVILFPQAMLPLYIFEPRYRRMLTDCLEGNRLFAVAMQRPDRTRESPVGVAGLGLIRAAVRNRDDTSHLVLQGLARVVLGPVVRYRPYRLHHIKPLPPTDGSAVAVHALVSKVLELVGERLELGIDFPFKAMHEPASGSPEITPSNPNPTAAADAFRQVIEHLSQREDPEQLVDLVSATLIPAPAERQLILETARVEDRLRHLIRFLMKEIRRRKP